MSIDGRTIIRKYQTLYTLAGLFRVVGWLIMVVGGVVAIGSMVLSTQITSGLGQGLSLFPAGFGLLTGLLGLITTVFTGVGYLAASELIKLFIDLAISNQFTARRLDNLAPVSAAAPDLSALQNDLAQLTLVLREVSANTQQTAALLEQATKPRSAAAK
ncbi:MAG: hypothetical protein HY870_03795 [Chloroflexi bacterium]|nr:hypothetical protein [Chloroflexota bacterium]